MTTIDKENYVRRKWRQVIIPFSIAAIAAVIYVSYSTIMWIFGNTSYVEDDLFRFCLILLAFYVPFYVFLKIIRAVVLAGPPKSRK